MYRLLKSLFADRFSELKKYRESHPGKLPAVTSELKRSILKGRNKGFFQVVIYNDDTTPMEFVIDVLEYYIGYSTKDAAIKMARIHKVGCSGIYTSNESLANAVCELIEGASLSKGYELRCCVQGV